MQSADEVAGWTIFFKENVKLAKSNRTKTSKIYNFYFCWHLKGFCYSSILSSNFFKHVQMVILLISLGLNILFDAVKVVKVSQILLPQKCWTLEPLHNFALRCYVPSTTWHHIPLWVIQEWSTVPSWFFLWILFIYFFHASAIFWVSLQRFGMKTEHILYSVPVRLDVNSVKIN